MLYAAEVITARTIQSWNAPRSTLGMSGGKRERERENIKSAALSRLSGHRAGAESATERMNERTTDLRTDGRMIGLPVGRSVGGKSGKWITEGRKKENAARKQQAERIRRISARRYDRLSRPARCATPGTMCPSVYFYVCVACVSRARPITHDGSRERRSG